MPKVVQAVAAWVARAAGRFLSSVGVTGTALAVATQAVYVTTQILIYYGTSKLLNAGGSQDLPPPVLGQVSTKQAIPPRIRAFGQVRLSGPYMLYAAKDGVSHDVIALHDGLINSIEAYYLNDNLVTLSGSAVQSPDGKKYGSSSNLVTIETNLGLATETAYTTPASALPTLWSSDHRGDGVASLYLKSAMGSPNNYNVDYPDGLPVASVVVKAQKVYDWRNGSHDIDDASTWAWSDNPILCLASYLCVDLGFDFEVIITPNLTNWTTAANACDDTITTPAGSEKRFRLGGAYYTNNAASAVIGQILAACSGYLADDGRGGLKVWVGKYAAPSVTIDDTLDVIDSYYFTRGDEAEQSFNAFDVTYTNPTEKYNQGDAGRWRNEDLITRDGEVRATSLQLGWVQSPYQAQRCAKMHDAKQNSPLKGFFVGGLSLLQCMGERIVNLNITDNAALTGIMIMPTKIEILDLMSGKVKVNFIKITEADFDFNTSTDYVDIDTSGSGGTGSTSFDVPTDLAVTVIDLGGALALRATWTPIANENVTYDVQLTERGVDNWRQFNSISTETERATHTPVYNGVEYSVRVRARGYAWSSDWSDSVHVLVLLYTDGMIDFSNVTRSGMVALLEDI